MGDHVNKFQVCTGCSFGHLSIYIADVGKNGGHRFIKKLSSYYNYGDRYKLNDRHAGVSIYFKSVRDMCRYYEETYASEIEWFHFKESK